jgi:taurine dioxygenase
VEIRPVTASIGARVRGVDLRDAVEVAADLRRALLEHHVLFIPSQHLSDEDLRGVAELFGDTRPPLATGLSGQENPVGQVEHDADRRPHDTGFHSDLTFCDEVPAVGVLYARILPARGGDTIWANMHAAFETLSDRMRDFLARLTARHSLDWEQVLSARQYLGTTADQEASNLMGGSHPVVIRHTGSDRPALFVNPAYTKRVLELEEHESDALLRMLFAHMNQPWLHCRHHWEVDDVAIWDEQSTAHQGPFDYWPERRLLKRITAGLVRPAALDERLLIS